MALIETGGSILVLAIVLILGLKIIKHVIYTIILIIILGAILWYTGYLDPASFSSLVTQVK